MYSYFLDNGVDGGALLCIEELPEWLSSSVYGVKIKFQKLMKDLFSRKISIISTVVSFFFRYLALSETSKSPV
jgi:hypothetical protein